MSYSKEYHLGQEEVLLNYLSVHRGATSSPNSQPGKPAPDLKCQFKVHSRTVTIARDSLGFDCLTDVFIVIIRQCGCAPMYDSCTYYSCNVWFLVMLSAFALQRLRFYHVSPMRPRTQSRTGTVDFPALSFCSFTAALCLSLRWDARNSAHSPGRHKARVSGDVDGINLQRHPARGCLNFFI